MLYHMEFITPKLTVTFGQNQKCIDIDCYISFKTSTVHDLAYMSIIRRRLFDLLVPGSADQS